MDKKERFLIWHHKHHHICSIAWTALGWATLPVVAMIHNAIGGFWFWMLLWYAIFGILPSGVASALMIVCTEKLILKDNATYRRT